MIEENYAPQAIGPKTLYASEIDRNPTVEENIDMKIKRLQTEIDRLQQSKVDLGPLMKMRIRDIRNAMDY
jgi:hypothetical protein